MGFDLSKNNFSNLAENGYEFELRVPEVNEPTGAYVTVRGKESAKVQAFSRRQFNRMQQQEQLAKRKNRDPEPMTLDEAEEMAVDSAAIRVLAWRGIMEGKKEVECTEENVKRILKEHPWIREQIMRESDALANFIPTSA